MVVGRRGVTVARSFVYHARGWDIFHNFAFYSNDPRGLLRVPAAHGTLSITIR